MKAYCTRVGEGPFPTELGTYDETKEEGTWDKIEQNYEKEKKEALKKQDKDYFAGKYMRLQGKEYGTTTGRPRRTGWFDAVAAKYSAMVNGLTSVVITKLDVLTGLKEVKICTVYENTERSADFLPDANRLEKATPVYESVPGWDEDITKAKSFEDLPQNAQKYLKRIEELIGVPVSIVSVGPERDETIVVKDIF